jgi:hypothetical protein
MSWNRSVSLEEDPCCPDMQYAIQKWALYADTIDGTLSINEDLEEGEQAAADFKYCPWCSKLIPRIHKVGDKNK